MYTTDFLSSKVKFIHTSTVLPLLLDRILATEKTTRTPRVHLVNIIVVVLDVCPSVRLSSVETNSFRGNLISNRPIDLKIGLNVR